jgi:uncharacterized protein YndB with AHSA1/START domain
MPSRVLVALRVAATPERAFEAFTTEIGQWWRPNELFRFTDASASGRLAFEPGPGGRLMEQQSGGEIFEIGQVTVWEPPDRLAFSWRQASFSPDQRTEVHVRFEHVGSETRVTVGTLRLGRHSAGARRPPRLRAGRHPAAPRRVVAGTPGPLPPVRDRAGRPAAP